MLPEKSQIHCSQVMFRSGEMVPSSGIWRPEHDHVVQKDGEIFQLGVAGELWLRAQTPFPPCPGCGAAVSFFMTEEIPHISEDPDFQ